MKIIMPAIFVATVLGGCVSNDDLSGLQSQVSRLDSQVASLKSTVSVLQNELAVVKGQRVVRLPTGAPTKTRKRSAEQPSYAVSDEQKQLDSAIAMYKSGDIKSAVSQLEQFNVNYPNSKHHGDVLYYLGSAYYTLRDYNRAQQVLEELVYQSPMNQVSPKALALLEKVYSASGNTNKLKELKGFMQNLG